MTPWSERMGSGLSGIYRICKVCLNKIPKFEKHTPRHLMMTAFAFHCDHCGGWSIPPIPLTELGQYND